MLLRVLGSFAHSLGPALLGKSHQTVLTTECDTRDTDISALILCKLRSSSFDKTVQEMNGYVFKLINSRRAILPNCAETGKALLAAADIVDKTARLQQWLIPTGPFQHGRCTGGETHKVPESSY